MILSIAAIAIGLVVLVWSADLFVDGAVGVAEFFGMSTFLIGMIIVGFGTSAPELVVSVLSAMNNTPQLALGNAYGSNIANIALILGVTAIIIPVVVQKQVMRRDIPILLMISVLTVFLLKDGNVSFVDGIVMLLVFVAIMALNISLELHAKHKREKENQPEAAPKKVSIAKSSVKLLVSLVLLIGSSRLLVWGAVYMARALGVSDLLIGLTIVAIGTSLPELASSIAAARKGENDLAVGNIIGSNVFNTLAVVGLAAVISPMQSMDPDVLHRDLPIMLALTFLLFFISIPIMKKGNRSYGFGRLGGAFFLILYIGYLVLLGVGAQGSA